VPEQVDETTEAPLPACPNCGGPVTAVVPVEQFFEAVPLMRPRVTRWSRTRGRVLPAGM
jgi:hypothetical protein